MRVFKALYYLSLDVLPLNRVYRLVYHAYLAHELCCGVLSRKQLVEVLEVVLGKDRRQHFRSSTDVYDPVRLLHESAGLELCVDCVRRSMHLGQRALTGGRPHPV